MRYSRVEIARARALRAGGLVWKPRLGDWYVTDHGFVAFVRGHGEVGHVASRHTWLPGWVDCRRWLAERGWRHPETPLDDPGRVRIVVVQDDGRTLSADGATDLECLYGIIGAVLADNK